MFLEKEVGGSIPLSSLPRWNDVAQLRDECQARCSDKDKPVLKKAKTEEALERFLFARTRGGSELTSNALKGVRYCNIQIVKKDLEERGMAVAGVDDATMRARMEVRLRLEEEWKGLRILRKDEMFLEGDDGAVQNDLSRVLIDLLHAPMRMNEKVPSSHLLKPPPPCI